MISPWNISSCNQHLATTKKQKGQSWSMRSNDVPRSTRSSLETRVSLVFALASQAASLSQRILGDLVMEASKYSFPRSFDSRTLEEAMMTVPDLETIEYKIIKRTDEYEIREVEAYYVAETTMPGKTGLDFVGSSQGFNVLAEYLFGKNTSNKTMEMTTPVITKKAESKGEKMDMTTPVITKQTGDSWTMSFVMPSKYGENLPSPKDSSVRIKKVPQKIVAAVAFSGFVTDEDVKKRESKLRDALGKDSQFQVKENAYVEISQFNPPFTLPFNRRNEIALEVERKPEM